MQRLAPRLPLPRSPFIPGQGPRPDNDRPSPQDADEAFAYGVDLWNAGCPWEAHEAWEAAWVAEGREGEPAELLKGLIKLAAACVKRAQGQPIGVRTHAEGALRCLAGFPAPPARYPVDLERARGIARALLEDGELPELTLLQTASV